MNTASDKACEVCHVDHEIRSDFIGDGAHAREVELARVSAAATYDHLWVLAFGFGSKLVVVNGFGVFASLVADDSVDFAGEIQLVAVGDMHAVSQLQAEDAIS